MLDPRDGAEAPLLSDLDSALYGPKGGAYRPADLAGLVIVTSPDDQVCDIQTGEWMKRSEFERRAGFSALAADDGFHRQASNLE